MKRLILTVGLPRSGKSTWAKEQGHPIVNRDAIRLALHGKAYIMDAEPMVTAIEDYMVRSLFLAGHSTVIVDACHVTQKRRERWVNPMWIIEWRIIDTRKGICIQRAWDDDREDLIPIIESMWKDCDIPEIRSIQC